VNFPEETTVAVLGGGPAGATTAAYLALAGIDHVVLERAHFPRHHVGESLVGATNRIFHEIGFLEKLDAAGFPHKQGAVWVPKSGKGSQSIRVVPDGAFGGLDYTFHVDRARFDHMLLDHAASLGSPVFQGALVNGIETDDDGRVETIRVKYEGETRSLKTRYVVDATGRSTFLGSKFRLKEKDPLFDQYAIYGYWKGVGRGPEETAGYIHIHFLPTERGWVWQIPIDDEITSIGVVTERADFQQDGRDPEAYYARHLGSNPELSERLKYGTRVSEVRAEGNYSYGMRELVGPGFMLVGDAARFVDPIFSSGVSVAIYSAKFAVAELVEVLSGKKSESDALASYEAQMRSGIKIWYDFIKIYYKLQNLFTYYLKKPGYREELVRLLQGNVYDADDLTVLDRLREDIRRIEATPDHVMREGLSDIPI
jgi:flavin-dependent dehydrogenase